MPQSERVVAIYRYLLAAVYENPNEAQSTWRIYRGSPLVLQVLSVQSTQMSRRSSLSAEHDGDTPRHSPRELSTTATSGRRRNSHGVDRPTPQLSEQAGSYIRDMESTPRPRQTQLTSSLDRHGGSRPTSLLSELGDFDVTGFRASSPQVDLGNSPHNPSPYRSPRNTAAVTQAMPSITLVMDNDVGNAESGSQTPRPMSLQSRTLRSPSPAISEASTTISQLDIVNDPRLVSSRSAMLRRPSPTISEASTTISQFDIVNNPGLSSSRLDTNVHALSPGRSEHSFNSPRTSTQASVIQVRDQGHYEYSPRIPRHAASATDRSPYQGVPAEASLTPQIPDEVQPLSQPATPTISELSLSSQKGKGRAESVQRTFRDGYGPEASSRISSSESSSPQRSQNENSRISTTTPTATGLREDHVSSPLRGAEERSGTAEEHRRHTTMAVPPNSPVSRSNLSIRTEFSAPDFIVDREGRSTGLPNPPEPTCDYQRQKVDGFVKYKIYKHSCSHKREEHTDYGHVVECNTCPRRPDGNLQVCGVSAGMVCKYQRDEFADRRSLHNKEHKDPDVEICMHGIERHAENGQRVECRDCPKRPGNTGRRACAILYCRYQEGKVETYAGVHVEHNDIRKCMHEKEAHEINTRTGMVVCNRCERKADGSRRACAIPSKLICPFQQGSVKGFNKNKVEEHRDVYPCTHKSEEHHIRSGRVECMMCPKHPADNPLFKGSHRACGFQPSGANFIKN